MNLTRPLRLLFLATASVSLTSCVDPYYAGGYPPPPPVIGGPGPVYVAPAPVYVAPRPIYVAPRPLYGPVHRGGYYGPRRW